MPERDPQRCGGRVDEAAGTFLVSPGCERGVSAPKGADSSERTQIASVDETIPSASQDPRLPAQHPQEGGAERRWKSLRTPGGDQGVGQGPRREGGASRPLRGCVAGEQSTLRGGEADPGRPRPVARIREGYERDCACCFRRATTTIPTTA